MVREASASLAICLRILRAVILTLGLVLLIFGGSGCGKDDTSVGTDDKKGAMPTTKPVNVEKSNELRSHSESLDGMDIDKVRELIAAGADVNLRNKYNATTLYMATGMKQAEIVKFLLAANADVHAAPGSGMTPLVVAAGNGDVGVVKLLLAAGARVDLPPGEFHSLRYEIPFAPKLPKRYRDTPLYRMHLAPLWVASACGHLEIVKLLLDAGADVYVTDVNGFGPDFIGNGDVAKLLLAHREDTDKSYQPQLTNSPLFRAITRNRLEKFKQLLAAKADMNTVYRYGTPLVCALLCRRPEMTRLLRAAGADLNVSDTFSMVAAARYGRQDIVKLMLEAGATPNPIRLKARPSPLYAACAHGHIGVVRLLLNAGAEVNAIVLRGEEEWTPMRIAKSRGHTAVAELLKKHGGKE
jgi:uncharacterized protein